MSTCSSRQTPSGFRPEDYTNDKITADELFRGYRPLTLSSGEMDIIYKTGLPVSEDWFDEPLCPMNLCMSVAHDEPGHETLARRVGDLLLPLRYAKESAWGLTPLNRNQRMAFELLMDPTVPFVTITGRGRIRPKPSWPRL